MANEPHNLYDYKDYFRLVGAGGIKYVGEPQGWDKIAIKIQRDKDYYGVNYEFVDPSVTLVFEVGKGYEEIEAEYKLAGGDGKMQFHYGYEYKGIQYTQFQGTINFNTRRRSNDGVEVQIEKQAFDALLRTRSETKVDMTQVKDFNDAAVVPPSPVRFKLHSKRLRKSAVLKDNAADMPPSTISTNNIFSYIQPDTTNPVTQEIDETFSMPLAITFQTAIAEDRFQFNPKEKGKTRIHWAGEFDWVIVFSISPLGHYELTPTMQIVRGGQILTTLTTPTLSGSTSGINAIVHHSFDMVHEYDAQVGDKLFFNVFVKTAAISRVVRVKDWKGVLEITQETQADASYALGYRLFDMLNFAIQCATGKANTLQSSFFSPGGCGYKYLVTNGFQLRNFDIANRPVKAAWKDMLEGIGPVWNNGVQFGQNLQGADRVIVEHFDYFFQGLTRIVDLQDVYDYNEEHAQDVTYNEAELGYQKIPEGELNTLDEFNTVHKWLLPVQSYKGLYSRKSKFITSGYLIEQQRREQFKDNPSSSLTNDDELFLIAVSEVEAKYEDLFYTLEAAGYITTSRPLGMQPGDKFKITLPGGLNNNTAFTVDFRVYGLAERYKIHPNPVAEQGTGILSIALPEPAAERNEAFAQVDNVISPETAYNLRLTPLHLLYNHATLLNVGTERKVATEIIKTTETQSNAELITQYSANATCKMLDQNLVLKENANIRLLDLQTRRRPFLPIMCHFKARVKYDEVVKIRASYTDQNPSQQDNRGTISFVDDLGDRWEGIVWAMSYQPDEEVCSFDVRKVRKL